MTKMELTELDASKNILLRQLREGDQMAFEWFFKTYQPALVFFAHRILFSRNIAEAEEIVQDVLLKFYDRRQNFDQLNAIKAFLYISTKNACLQVLEKDKVRERRFAEYRSGYTDIQESILDDIIYAEVIRELVDAIELLPPQCRTIMKLFTEEGKTAKEIAAELGITVSTVNNQKSKAILILRKRLSGSGILLLSVLF